MIDNTNTSTETDDEEVDLSLLDKNLSDIDDLPSFEVPAKGTYILLANATTKKVNKHPAMVIDLDVVSTVALANTGDTPPKEGDKFGVLFMLDNEFGMGNMKKVLAPFAAHFGTDNVKTLVKEKIQNCVISATVDHQIDREDKTKIYARLKNIVVQG